MAFYLVRARPRSATLEELEERLQAEAFVDLEPFGRALTKGLRNARLDAAGAIWEEEDYCSPPPPRSGPRCSMPISTGCRSSR